VPLKTRKALAALGHRVRVEPTFSGGFGSGDVIMVDPDSGVLCGAADPRKDGCAVGY
jgi:gamma-glutamyltranspeptidase/glutathione hydrolase